jgi:hypothetical protein
MFQRVHLSKLQCSRLMPIQCLLVVWLHCAANRSMAQTNLDPEHVKKMSVGTELFKSDVRPTLVGRCLKCHGGESTESNFNLATREGLMAGGDSGKAIDTKAPENSLFIKLIRHAAEPVMPEDGAKLDERQIRVIEKWIGLGAPYDRPLIEAADSDPSAWTKRVIHSDSRDFWAFQKLRSVSPPAFEQDRWPQNDIDRFVLDKLRSVDVEPNTRADNRGLVRRAYLDLLGLPPTIDQLEEFLHGDRAGNWEKVVDRLLADEHYGERMGRHWLDLARFAESFGFEQDYDRPNAYHYRDFVIRALNQDMPYNQFSAWQIAGDELAPLNPDARMATGFLGAGVFPTQLTEKEFESARYDELDDLVATLGTTFLGLTVGCARCHDHKYDPIPSRDYYQLISVFREAIRSNAEIAVDPIDDQKRLESWEREHAPLVAAIKDFEATELLSRFDRMLTKLTAKQEAAAEGSRLTAIAESKDWNLPASTKVTSKSGSTMIEQADGSFLASGTLTDTDRYTFELETLSTKITALRLDAIPDPSLPKGGLGRSPNGNFGLSKISVTAEPLDRSRPPVEVKLAKPKATFEQNGASLSIASALDDKPKTGWAIDPQIDKMQSATFELDAPVEQDEGVRLRVTLDFQVNKRHHIGRPRISITGCDALPSLEAQVQSSWPAEQNQFLLRNSKGVSESQRTVLLGLYMTSDARWQELNRAINEHLQSKPKPQLVTAMVFGEGLKPIPNHGDGRGYPHFYSKAFFLKRGDVNQKQGEADIGFLQALTSIQAQNPDSEAASDWSRWQRKVSLEPTLPYRREALANWLTDTEHGAGQQLARVMVNRIWQYHFGQGLVATASDFGFQGDRPTHPELLDWLAQRLIEGGWRLKPIHKLIMMSATYQQSSNFDESKARVDPKNQWLWRFSPRRLEAEVIRDSILAASGQLDRTMFGAGTLDESMKRRSIYFFIKRSQLIPFMQVFDSPEPLVSVGQRPSTTIAPQALMFMNNTQVRNWSRSFARVVISARPDSIELQVAHAYRTALARDPSNQELRRASEFVRNQTDSYGSVKTSKPEEMALADLCQTLISLNEFIYVD